MGLVTAHGIWRSIGKLGRRLSVADRRKRGSLSEAFEGVAPRRENPVPATKPENARKIQEPETQEIEMVPGRGGKLIAANTPVNMTFTVSAKERYEWTLELRRRGLSAVSVLREAMNELLMEGTE
jgi:hypothetical protein